MRLMNTITPGDKIDIKMIYQTDSEELQHEDEQTYLSSVSDILGDNKLEILMPTYGGKLKLLQVSREYSLVFYTKNGLYNCRGIVTDRYYRGNLAFLSVLLVSDLVKFQRRGFFRIPFTTYIEYYEITDKVAALKTTRELMMEIQKPAYTDAELKGVTQDISGGGVRFVSEKPLRKNQYIFLAIRITNNGPAGVLYLVGKVIDTFRQENVKEEKYVNRVKFMYKDLKDREKIVHFVFEEERKLRKKELG